MSGRTARRLWQLLPCRARLVLVRPLELASRLSSKGAGVVLVYHALADRTGDPNRELVPPHGIAAFDEQLSYLKRRYDVVRADELLDAVRGRRRGGRYPVAVTFDDDLASHVTKGLPVLQRHKVHATFFLSAASLDRPFAFWWERLQRAYDLGVDLSSVAASPATGIHALASRIELETAPARAALSDRLGELVGGDPPAAGARARDVRTLFDAGFAIGFHTRRHDRLPELPDGDLARAMTDGRAELERLTGEPLATIAYPHGQADPRVAHAARSAGFVYGFTGSGRAVTAGSDPLLLGRIEPTLGDVASFARQLAWVVREAHR